MTTTPPTVVPSFVFKDGTLHKFNNLDAAEDFAGCAIAEDIRAIVDAECTVFFIEAHGDMPEDFERTTQHAPPQHRRALASSGFALLQTNTDDPVLVVDAGEQHFLLVASAPKLEVMLARRYGDLVPLSVPRADPTTRWVVTIAEDGSLCRSAMGFGVQPGVATA